MAGFVSSNPNIEVVARRVHEKASEVHLDVQFHYPSEGETWDGSVPIEDPRTNTQATTQEQIQAILQAAYDSMLPETRQAWLEEQTRNWSQFDKPVTRPFFDALSDFRWKCTTHEMPRNTNPQRRIQDIKDMGYTVVAKRMSCQNCGRTTTHLILLALPRAEGRGYETISQVLRERILDVLDNYDAYEGRRGGHLLPDHKFPEVRWDARTREENAVDMTDEEIKEKFQLLSNQRNEQKREVCRNCFQTGKRGAPFGMKYFYEGGEDWPAEVPQRGSEAERGCVGCGWYDLDRWRSSLVSAASDA